MRSEIALPGDPNCSRFSVRQRLLSGSLGLAVSGSFSASGVLAHPAFSVPPYMPVTTHRFLAPSLPNVPRSPSSEFSTANTLHPSNNSAQWSASSPTSNGSHANILHVSKSAAQSVISSSPSADDLELNSSVAIFSPGSLAGFHQITIDIGGKQQQLNINSKVTAAELVAAQQVLSGGKQEITINTKGVATGGYFDLNATTLASLDGPLGGNIGSLYVSHGVVAIDTLSNLSLGGTLVNQGKIDIGSAGQALDTISAANITNASGASINGVSGTAVGLSAAGTFSNSGTIANAASVNVTAPTIANSGSITSTAGNVNLSGVAGNLTVNGAAGTVQATHGNINLDGGGANGNITASGGSWLSQQINFNAGTGTVEADLGQISGVVNGTAGCAHVTASTSNLQLGDLNVSGDPTYYNNSGNITIDGTVAATGGNDLAIVASGNIIGNGGTLDTSSGTKGGSLTLIAGANFTPTGSGLPDASNTTITVTDSKNTGKGSATGGYIDLSGITLTGNTKNTPVTAVTTNGGTGAAGDILMVAYKGTASNSGSIVATETAKQTGGATAITAVGASDGQITLVGGGAQITAQSINGGAVTILAGTPTIVGGSDVPPDIKILNGTIQASSGTYSTFGAFSATAINVNSIGSNANVTIATGGATSGTSKAPMSLDATGLTFTGTGTASSLFVNSTGVSTLTLNASSVSSLVGTLSVTAAGDIAIANNITGKGTIDLTTKTGAISGAGIIFGTSANLSAGGAINVDTGVNTLTVNGGGTVSVSESNSVGKALSLLTSSSNGMFSLFSLQPLTINGVLSTNGGAVNIAENEVTTNTINGTTTVAGITVAKAINSGSGSILLGTTGNENLVEKSVVLVSPNITLDAGGSLGTTGTPFVTQTPTLTVTAFSTNGVHVKDLSTGSFAISGTTTVGGGTLTVVSEAKSFTLNALPFTNVTVTDSVAGATTTLNAAASTVGDGTGLVTITTAGNLLFSAGSIAADTAVLTSSGGNIGASGPGNSFVVNASTLTANAVKGSVYLQTAIDTTLNTGTALSNYQVTAANLDLAGSIKVTDLKAGSIVMNISGLMTQDLPTTNLSAFNVSLSTTADNAFIGDGIGFQSIQTKAIGALTITSTTGSDNTNAFVTQNANITLNTNSSGDPSKTTSLSLAAANGAKLTVGSTIDYTNVSLIVPTTLTVNTTGQLNATNLTITSPIVVLDNTSAKGSGSINITPGGSTSFISGTTLSITGPGTVYLGSSLTLSGQLGITLGATSGVLVGKNDPLNAPITTGSLTNLTIFTTGIFTGNYNQFILDTGNADSLSVSANSLKNTGTFTGAPFVLEADGSANTGTNSNSVNLALTGTTNITLGMTVAAKNKPLEYDIVVGGTNGGSASVFTAGVLNLDNTTDLKFGLDITPAANNNISLTGTRLPFGILPTTYFNAATFNSVSLTASTGTFVLGATGNDLKNGIAGGVAANIVNISAPSGLTINSTVGVTGAQIGLNTGELKMNGTVTGVGSVAVPNPILSLSNFNGTSLTIADNTTGSYSGISSVVIQSTSGGVNLGSLFTSSTLLGNATLDSIAISAAGGSVIVPTTLSTLSVTNGGVIYVNAGSISYSPNSKNPQPFLTLGATNGTVTLQTANPITLGKVKGDFDVEVGAAGTYAVTSKGSLSVDEPLSTSFGSLTGFTINLKADVSATNTLSVVTSNSKSSQINAKGFEMSAGELIIGIGGLNAIAPLNISTPDLVVVSGGLKLNNVFNGDVTVSQQFNVAGSAPLYSLDLVNSSGLATSTINIGSISTTAGNLEISNTNGHMVVLPGASLSTQAGNIYIQNNDLINGTIVVDPNVTMHGSAFGTELGQIYIIMGAIPIVIFSLHGPTPGPDVPLTSATGFAEIFFTTTANPLSTITSIGLNSLNASGRNVVFNGAGNSSAITLEGGDVITADPPPMTAAMISAAAQANAGIIAGGIGSTPSLVSNVASSMNAGLGAASIAQNQSGVFSIAGQNPVLNWALPTTMQINNLSRLDGVDSDLALPALIGTKGEVRNGDNVGSLSSGSRTLTGKVSNSICKTLEHGVTMVAPKEKTIIETRLGAVSIAPGAVAMVMAFDGGLAVYNLHDTRGGAVSVAVGDNTVNLMPGQNALFSDRKVSCFEAINPAPTVAYRAIVPKEWARGINGFRSEFSILSMLQSVDALQKLMRDQDLGARKTMGSVLKTSAILMQLGGEPFQFMQPPPVTAMTGK